MFPEKTEVIIKHFVLNFRSNRAAYAALIWRLFMKWVCDACGYVYDETLGDPENGIAAGTKWEDIPADFVCPLCGMGKDNFYKV